MVKIVRADASKADGLMRKYIDSQAFYPALPDGLPPIEGEPEE